MFNVTCITVLDIKLLYTMTLGASTFKKVLTRPKHYRPKYCKTKYVAAEVPVTLEELFSIEVTSKKLSKALMLCVFFKCNFSDCNNKKRELNVK